MRQKEATERAATQSTDPCGAESCLIDSMPEGTRNRWVQCEECDNWFHGYCVDLVGKSNEDLEQLDFTCIDCE